MMAAVFARVNSMVGDRPKAVLRRKRPLHHLLDGGAKGSRTPDLLNAIQALSQLSYGPIWRRGVGNPAPVASNLKV
jgi:hypothetical protein